MDSPSTRYKILCLHGAGSNAEVFEAQTAPIRYQLHSSATAPEIIFDFDFVDGPHPWPAHTSIAKRFGKENAYFSYYDGSASSLNSAVDDLAHHVIENGPYDAVMGFSMGGALAATLLLEPQDGGTDRAARVRARGMIRSAIFLCSALPADPQELENGNIRRIGKEDVGCGRKMHLVDKATVHVWSPSDTEERAAGESVVQMCNASKRAEVVHMAGHAVPADPKEVREVAGAIKKMLSDLEK